MDGQAQFGGISCRVLLHVAHSLSRVVHEHVGQPSGFDCSHVHNRVRSCKPLFELVLSSVPQALLVASVLAAQLAFVSWRSYRLIVYLILCVLRTLAPMVELGRRVC